MKWGTKIAVAAGFVGAVAFAATAFGQSGSSNSTDSGQNDATVAAHGRDHKLGRFGRRLVHGEFKIKTDKGFATVIVDTGTVTSVDPAAKKLTLKRADGVSVTVTATDQTRVRKDGERSTFDQIKTGDLVRVLQVNSGNGFVVRAIRDRSPGAEQSGARQTSFFGDVPDSPALLGILLIAGSGFYTLHRERVRARSAAGLAAQQE